MTMRQGHRRRSLTPNRQRLVTNAGSDTTRRHPDLRDQLQVQENLNVWGRRGWTILAPRRAQPLALSRCPAAKDDQCVTAYFFGGATSPARSEGIDCARLLARPSEALVLVSRPPPSTTTFEGPSRCAIHSFASPSPRPARSAPAPSSRASPPRQLLPITRTQPHGCIT